MASGGDDLAAVTCGNPVERTVEKKVSVSWFAPAVTPWTYFAEDGKLGICTKMVFWVAAEGEEKVAVRLSA